MNYAEYIIGLGAGIVISMTIRLITDARNEKREALEEKENLHRRWHDCANSKLTTLVSQIEMAMGRIDQHAGRIEKLEAKKK